MPEDELNSFFNYWKQKINSKIIELLSLKERSKNTLKSAMRYTLLNGGKRLRPVLCIAGAEVAGGGGEDVLPFACAIELIHTYSLIHDDLPCMDNADTRRGRASCHIAFNESIAILTGDALLTEAFRIMTDASLYKKSIRKNLLSAVNLVSASAGMNGMVEGQVFDIGLIGKKKAALNYLNIVNMKKTAMLMGASVSSGALLVSGKSRIFKTLHDFGINFGMAFQIMDDLNDIDSDEPSIPAIYGEKVAKRVLLRYINKSRQSLKELGKSAGILNRIVDYIFKEA